MSEHCPKRTLTGSAIELLPDSNKKSKPTPINQYSAVQQMKSSVLCKFWRNSVLTNNTTFKLAKAYADKGLLVSTMKTVKFDEITLFLKQKDTVDLAQQYLMRIQNLSILLHGTDHFPNGLFNVKVRVFLAGYMILTNPESVFEKMGDLETTLLDSTKKLSSNFEAILKAITNEKKTFCEIPIELTKAFPVLLYNFLDCFGKWKVVDEAKLIARIKHALIALLHARSHCMFDDCLSAGMNSEILIELKRLKGKLLQIGGPNIVRDFEIENPDIKCLESQTNKSQESISDHEYYKGKYTTNEQMAHELLLDPTFEMCEVNYSPAFCNITRKAIKETFLSAFWNSIADDMRFSPPCYVRIIRILFDIRDGIVELSGGSLKEEEITNINMLVEKIESNVWDWEKMTQLIAALFEKVQIIQFPNRVAETMTMWEETKKVMDNASEVVESQTTAFCKAIRFLLERVQVFRMDVANRHLRSITPLILDHGIEYEQDKMKEKLESGILTTDRTRAWLKESICCLLEDHSILVEYVVEGNAAAIVTAHGSALVDLIENKTLPVPETLMFDIRRIEIMRSQYQKMVVYSVVLVTVKHCLGNDAAEAEMVAQLVAAEAEGTLDWKNHCISIGGAIVGTDRLDGYMKEIEKRLADPLDPVHALMRTRVRAFWEKAVKGPRTTTDELRGAEGLKTMASEWTTKLALVANLNLRIHGPLYNSIIPLAAIEARSQ